MYCPKEYLGIFQKYGFNPLYGNQLVDVLGTAKMILGKTSIMEIVENLSKVFEFDPSWAARRLKMRPDWPDPDDFAKYSYYF